MTTTKTRPRPATRTAGARTTARPTRPPMDARIRQRRAQVRRAAQRRRRRAVLAVLLVLAGVGAAVGITRSPLFAITAVRVVGVRGEEAQQVRAAAQVQSGQNLMTADLDEALARTREIPWVATAEVRREPPSTVVLAVTPRRPAAVIEVSGTHWVVDPTGVVIEPGGPRELPRLALAVPVAPIPGQPLTDAAARNALDLHRVLPADLRRAARSLEAVGVRTVRVELQLHELDDPRGFGRSRRLWVRMGSAGDVGEQVAVLRALLGQRKAHKLPVPAEVDVRVPGNPVVLP